MKKQIQKIQSLTERNIPTLFKGKWWISAIVTLVIIVLGYSLIRNWDTIAAYPWQINFPYLFGSIACYFLGLGAIFLAWHVVFRSLTGYVSLKADFRIFAISTIARRIPLPVWYLGSRVILYNEQEIAAMYTLTASGMEFILIGLSGIICFSLFLPWFSSLGAWVWFLPVIAILGVIILTIWPEIFTRLVNRLLIALKSPPLPSSVTRNDLLISGLFDAIAWIFSGVSVYFLFLALAPQQAPFQVAIGATILSGLVSMVASVTLPGGFILKELTLGVLISPWYPLSVGLTLSIIVRIFQTIIEITWVLLSIRVTGSDQPSVTTTKR